MWKTRKNGKLSAIQHCSECGKRLEPDMIIGKEPDDWLWLECDYCFEPICEKCSDSFFDEYRLCVTCLQGQSAYHCKYHKRD
jgi:hypothetical protein